jgi:hypothetical protein
LDRVGTTDGVRSRFGQTEVLDLAFADQILDGVVFDNSNHVQAAARS